MHVPHVVARLAARDDPASNVQARTAVAPDLERLGSTQGVSIDIDVSGTPWVKYRVRSSAPVSIVISTRDRPDLVERCLDSILQAGWRPDGEIIVVDNGSTDPRLAKVLSALSQRAAVRPSGGTFRSTFPPLCNAGVEASTGRVVVLLNNDTEARAGWLDELVSLATRSDVGAVGPLLSYPDGVIQSAGVLVGVNRTATSALKGSIREAPPCKRGARVGAG